MTDSQPEPIHVTMRVKGILMKTPEEQLRELLDGAHKFCEAVGLQEELITQIIDTDNEWALILKVDALLETAAKEILRKHLQFTLANNPANKDEMETFIEGLSMKGKTSVLTLLKAAGCKSVHLNFIDAVRTVRNAYAHDIRNLDVSLMAVIKQRNDTIRLMQCMSLLKEPTGAKRLAKHETSPVRLRFGIITLLLAFLGFAYHIAIK